MAATQSTQASEKSSLLFNITLWYLMNMWYNWTNKKLLMVFPLPWSVACAQMGIGCCYVAVAWTFFVKPPALVPGQWVKWIPLAVTYCVGHYATVVALSAGSIGFANVVKSCEPVFNLGFGALILGTYESIPVYLSLLPIMAGVGLATCSDLTFNPQAFGFAMLSNAGFALNVILSKKWMRVLMGEEEGAANFFAMTTLISFTCSLPIVILKECSLWEGAVVAAEANAFPVPRLALFLLCSGIGLYVYNDFAYRALSSIAPLTYAVAGALKRVTLIIFNAIFFASPMNLGTTSGAALAISGVYLHSWVKNREREQKEKAA